MGEPANIFHVSELEKRVQYDEEGRRRKPPIDLKKCKLQELVQYNCDIPEEARHDPRGVIQCHALLRTFRR